MAIIEKFAGMLKFKQFKLACKQESMPLLLVKISLSVALSSLRISKLAGRKACDHHDSKTPE